MPAEKQFENQIKAFLKTLPKTWFFKHWAGPYSTVGVPDIICCCNGYFVGIEVKAENGHATKLQKRNIELIKKAGGIGIILYPKHFEWFKELMTALSRDDMDTVYNLLYPVPF